MGRAPPYTGALNKVAPCPTVKPFKSRAILNKALMTMIELAPEEIEETRGCYCLAARKRARELTRRYEAALRPHGLRVTQFSVLAALAQTGPRPISRLAGILGLERTTLTRVAGVMCKADWLCVTPGGDERVHLLGITMNGKRVLAAALPAWKRVQDEITQKG